MSTTDRAALIARLREYGSTSLAPALMTQAADMLEADAQPATSDEWLANCPQSVRDLANRIKAEMAVPQEPVAWRELCSRLYVELHWCDLQMRSSVNEDGEPIWTQGSTVRDALADAKKALGAAPQLQRPRLTDAEIEAIAHRTATKYTHRSDPTQHAYGFVRHTLIDFARKVRGEA